MTTYTENFDYPDGGLDGNGGWVGSSGHTMFTVSNKQCRIVGNNNPSIIHNDVPSVPGDLIYASGSMNVTGDVMNLLETDIYASSNLSVPAAGVYVLAELDYFMLQYFDGWAFQHLYSGYSKPGGSPYGFQYLLNRSDDCFEYFIFNNVNYGELPLDTSHPHTGDIERVSISCYANTGVISMVDSLYLFSGERNRYGKMPKWQQTNYGLRPTY